MDNDITLALLKVGLSIETLKHKTAALNVAGYGNPDFRPQDVSFDIVLKKTLTNDADSQASPVSVEMSSNFTDRSDTDSVDLDTEVMNALNAEQRYKALLQMTNKRIGMMKLAIKGS